MKASNQTFLYQVIGALTQIADIQATIVWAKSVHVGGKTFGHFKPVNSDKYLNNCHEFILHLVNKNTKVAIDKLAIGVPFEDKTNITRFRGNAGSDVRCRGNVWFVPHVTRTKKLLHPATYSVELATMMIKYIATSEVICDPFVGSGTTAVAALKLKLPFMGCDISKKYIDAANFRVVSAKLFE
jgi:site-specific DNA-methyltransferase (adenine-specific)